MVDKANGKIYPVRIVALHKENSDSFDLSGNVYDVIFEDENQEVAGSLPNKSTIDPGPKLPDTIIVSDLLKHVKASDGRFYKQSQKTSPNNPRGKFTRKADTGDAIITLFKTADASTVIHELGHFFLDDMRKFADNPETAEQLQAIYKYVVKIKRQTFYACLNTLF